jgi:hypothetical protein
MEESATRWHELDGDAAGKSAYEIAMSLWDDQKDRRARSCATLVAYEGRELDQLSSSAYISGGIPDDIVRNVSRSAVETVCADIAGRSKPTVKIQTYGAKWSMKRQAKRLEKYIQGHIRRRQGPYLNTWALGEQLFRDATIWEFGAAKVYGVPKAGDVPAHIAVERVFPWELLVDPEDAKYGDPNCLFHVYTMDLDRAIWALAKNPALDLKPKERKENEMALRLAKEYTDDDESRPRSDLRATRRVQIVEAWSRRQGSGEPGAHIFCVENKTLVREDWKRDGFPFVRVFWTRDQMGWSGMGLVEEGLTQHAELNRNAQKMQERFRLCGAKRTYVYDGSLVNSDEMVENEAETIIKLVQGMDPPIDEAPKPIAESEWNYYQALKHDYYEDRGVSEMRATSRKEPGVESGIALRTLNDMGGQRFSLKARNHEWSFVDIAEHIVACSVELDEANEDLSSFMDEEIRWRDVKMPRESFEISADPISSLPNDPAGRLAMVNELMMAGVIQSDTYKSLLQWPDLESEMNAQTAQYRYMERVIERLLDSSELSPMYKSPDAFIPQKEAAMLQMAQAYLQAAMDDAPEYVLKLMRKWLQEMEVFLTAQQQMMQMQAAQMGAGAPPGEASPVEDSAPPDEAAPVQ